MYGSEWFSSLFLGEEGILHSPTREKLEPVLIRRKDIGNESTRSPQKVQPYIGKIIK